MNYSENFQELLARRDQIQNSNLFILNNRKPSAIKVFPDEVRDAILSHYFETLETTVDGVDFTSFTPDRIETGTVQVISVAYLDLWKKMLGTRNSISLTNRKDITVEDYSCSGNTILLDLQFKDESHAYFFTIYRKVTSWFSNSIRFKKEKGKFREETGNILALTPYVDAVICSNWCYILNEKNFNSIFKFDEVINRQIREREADIRAMSFISSADDFMGYLMKSNRRKRSMAKVLMQNRLEKIGKFSPEYIRKQIESQPELSFIQYNNTDQIVVNEKSFAAVVDILCCRINLDLITRELNGVDEL